MWSRVMTFKICDCEMPTLLIQSLVNTSKPFLVSFLGAAIGSKDEFLESFGFHHVKEGVSINPNQS